jgi:hypothetical protein
MTAVEILAMANAAISLAFQLWSAANQISGNETIPTWQDIVDENALLQAKIDAEKEA